VRHQQRLAAASATFPCRASLMPLSRAGVTRINLKPSRDSSTAPPTCAQPLQGWVDGWPLVGYGTGRMLFVVARSLVTNAAHHARLIPRCPAVRSVLGMVERSDKARGWAAGSAGGGRERGGGVERAGGRDGAGVVVGRAVQ